MELKGNTVGDLFGPAMEIRTQEEADQYFELLVGRSVELGLTRDEAEALVRSNLGYIAAYYSDETRARVEKLFRCAHPIFGAIAEKGSPSAELANELQNNFRRVSSGSRLTGRPGPRPRAEVMRQAAGKPAAAAKPSSEPSTAVGSISKAMADRQVCRRCGCTQNNACVFVDRRGVVIKTCSWIEPDLCDACLSLPERIYYRVPGWVHPPYQK